MKHVEDINRLLKEYMHNDQMEYTKTKKCDRCPSPAVFMYENSSEQGYIHLCESFKCRHREFPSVDFTKI
jgi:hypothetical protein